MAELTTVVAAPPHVIIVMAAMITPCVCHPLYMIICTSNSQDIILSLFFALGLGAGGSAMAVFARDWTDFDQPGVTYNARQIRDSLAAGAVSRSGILRAILMPHFFFYALSFYKYAYKAEKFSCRYRWIPHIASFY